MSDRQLPVPVDGTKPERIAMLESRIHRRQGELADSLRALNEAVRTQMPAEKLRHEAEENPYRLVSIAFLAGFALGAIV